MPDFPSLQQERTVSIEGFYTNVSTPNSKVSTPATASATMHESRQLLSNNVKVERMDGYMKSLSEDIDALTGEHDRIVNNMIKRSIPKSEDVADMRVSNVLIDRRYTSSEIKNLRATALTTSNIIGSIFRAYQTGTTPGPDGNIIYPTLGAVVTPGNTPTHKTSQGEKLTFDKCVEVASQSGYSYFGITDVENRGKWVGTCLVANDLAQLTRFGNIGDTTKAHVFDNIGPAKSTISIREDILGGIDMYEQPPSGLPQFVGAYPDRNNRAMIWAPNNASGTVFDAQRIAKAQGYKYFAIQYAQGRRYGQIFLSNDLAHTKKYDVPGARVNTESYEDHWWRWWVPIRAGDRYTKPYTLGGAWTNAVYTFADTAPKFVGTVNGRYAKANRTYSYPLSNWNEVLNEKNNSNGSQVIAKCVADMQNMIKRNGKGSRFGLYYEGGNGTGKIIGIQMQDVDLRNSSTAISLYETEPGTKNVFGTKDTIAVYKVSEQKKSGEYGDLRPNRVGEVFYVNSYNKAHKYPAQLIAPQMGVPTKYTEIKGKGLNYFDVPNISPESLHNVDMTLPMCRQICNEYYEQCGAFTFTGQSPTKNLSGYSNGTLLPKCSIKKAAPLHYTGIGMFDDNNGSIYLRQPDVNPSSTCTKNIERRADAYIMSSDPNVIRTDVNGQTIDPIEVSSPMSKDIKCGNYAQYLSDEQKMRKIQEDLNSKIKQFTDRLKWMKGYNADIQKQTLKVIPKVNTNVDKYQMNIDKISAYRDDGVFRLDSKKVENTSITRKSDAYMYTIWLMLVVIIVVATVLVMFKLRR